MNMELVLARKDKPITTSRIVAEVFEKAHKNVLRDIENLDCSENFRVNNFSISSYKDSSGKANKIYLITKNGFIFLVMGYTGKEASEIKEALIKEFDKLEDDNFIINIPNLVSSKAYDGFIYVIKAKGTDLYKIGCSNDINKRIATLETIIPFDLELIYSYRLDSKLKFKLESELHTLLQDKRHKGEWFKLNDNDIEKIISYCNSYIG